MWGEDDFTPIPIRQFHTESGPCSLIVIVDSSIVFRKLRTTSTISVYPMDLLTHLILSCHLLQSGRVSQILQRLTAFHISLRLEVCGKIHVSLTFGHKYRRLSTVRCRYNAIIFLPAPHQRHPIARPLGQGMGWFLWFQYLVYIFPQSMRRCLQYYVT